jgi:hypothetical protein
MLVVTAVVTGPTHAIARRWLAGQITMPLRSYLDELTAAACSALSGTPAGPRTQVTRSSAQHGRMRLQLVSEDGSIIAEGEATAQLAPPHAAAR